MDANKGAGHTGAVTQTCRRTASHDNRIKNGNEGSGSDETDRRVVGIDNYADLPLGDIVMRKQWSRSLTEEVSVRCARRLKRRRDRL
ncbi:hypothetical protein BaRGS_00005184 [Batillaria attramentaria]|uniref:Uncharacterized protein n=1 Tax=Batillaria attramentaria TaxID=370345 RepID=A0ABD0LVH2_9CAEN